MMNVEFDKVEGRISLHVGVEGSVLAQTVRARCDLIDVHYDVESAASPDQVAGVLRNARNGCYVRQTMDRPGLFDDSTPLNGEPFDPGDYPPPGSS